MKNNYIWEYRENEHWEYYETEIEKDYLYIYAIKGNGNPKMYMGMYIKNGNSINVWNKQYNDKMRNKGYCTSNGTPTRCQLLGSEDVNYMKRKLIYCYEHDKSEITP